MPPPAKLRAALVVGLLFLAWAFTLPREKAWGWDETLHAELPAAQLVLEVRELDLDAALRTVHGCQQYPPVGPLLLALPQVVLGVSEDVARLTQLALFAATLYGLFLLGQELARGSCRDGDVPDPRGELVPWLLLAFGVLSPLSLHYGATLFLETPFTFFAVFALRAWLRRGRDAGEREGQRHLAWRELVAGAWLTAAFFTKFNYGLLLAFGLGLDALCEGWLELRAGRSSEFLRRVALLAAAPLVAALYWFALPLPLGLDTAARHREAFLGFLGGNLHVASAPWQQRLFFAACYLTLSARLFALQGLAVLSSLRLLSQRGVRALWLVWLGAGIPVWTHNFHLDRFLIPGGPAFWALAAVGLACLLPRARPRISAQLRQTASLRTEAPHPRPFSNLRDAHVDAPRSAREEPRTTTAAAPPRDLTKLSAYSGARRARAAWLAGLAALTLVLPGADAPRLARALGLLATKPEARATQLEVIGRWSELGAGRPLPSAGTARAVYDGLLALAAAEAGPEERVGWFGTSSELSPGAIHLSLYAAGGSRGRLLADATRPMDVTFEARDPEWSDEQLARFVQGFDVVFATEPPDLMGRRGREFIRGYAQRLVERHGWSARLLGEVPLPWERPAGEGARLYALRPPR